MRYMFLCGLLALSACAHRPNVKGWAEKAAKQWASNMGNDHAIVSCISYNYYIDNGDAHANCSVNMGDRIYPLYCWVSYNDEDVPINHQCMQQK